MKDVRRSITSCSKIKIEGLRGDDAINALLDKKSGDPTTGAFKIQGGASGNVTPLRKR